MPCKPSCSQFTQWFRWKKCQKHRLIIHGYEISSHQFLVLKSICKSSSCWSVGCSRLQLSGAQLYAGAWEGRVRGQLTTLKFGDEVRNCIWHLCPTGVKVIAMTTCLTVSMPSMHLSNSEHAFDRWVKIRVSCYVIKLDFWLWPHVEIWFPCIWFYVQSVFFNTMEQPLHVLHI